MPFVSRPRVNWTPEMERHLMELFAYGLNATAVGEKLGISANAADARYRKLKKAKEGK